MVNRYLLCSLLLLLLIRSGQAQDMSESWFNSEKKWYYLFSSAFDPSFSYLTLQVSRDTIIDGVHAQVLKSILYRGPDEDYFDWRDEAFIVYHADRRVYRWVDSDFHLLYDFNLGLGDTLSIYIPIVDRWRDHDQSHTYLVVDSVSNFYIGDIELRALHFTSLLKFGQGLFAAYFYGWQIETIGSLRFFYPLDDLACDLDCPRALRCVEGLFGRGDYNFRSGSCDSSFFVKVSVHDEIFEDLVISPNPSFSDFFNITGLNNNFDDISIKLFDTYGRVIPHNTVNKTYDGIRIEPNQIALSGVYIVQIRLGTKVISKKVLLIK